jgi:putative transposase
MIFRDRKHPSHLTPLDHHAVVLLLTVCTQNRRKILAHEWVHQLIRRSWTQCDDFPVGRYVIMPDHIHAFVGENRSTSLQLVNWVAAWKSFVSLRWPSPKHKPIWQRSFWDRQIRSSDGYDQKWLYVRNNPVRHGIVKDPDDWPFQGSMNILSW